MRPRLVVGLLALATITTAGPAPSAQTGAPADPYVEAAAREHIPLDLLVAIAGSESGYHPWALNVHGHEIYCHSQAEADRLLADEDNVDIGLMQINWPFWGKRLGVTKQQLLDPRINLMLGARILNGMLARGGDIWRRISDYHSGSAERRQRYNRLVYKQYLHYLSQR